MRIIPLAGLLGACSGSDGGPGAGDTGTTTGPTGCSGIDCFLNTPDDVVATGDFSGFTPGASWEATTWLQQAVDPANVVGGDLAAIVEDFEKNTPVDKALVSFWNDDVFDAEPDALVESDVNGMVYGDATSCAPLTYRVTTDPILAETKTTFEAHQIYGTPDGGGIISGSFLSVSSTTYQLIPTLLGVTVDPDKAIVAGTAYDVARDAGLPSDDDTGKIEGAQVVVYDESGEVPASLVVNYFVEDFPDRDQKWTSPDGLWVASNVPPGELRVELWGNLDGVRTLLGATVVHSEADSINVSNIYSGYGNGVKYPSDCL
jgi:hypothetical protein